MEHTATRAASAALLPEPPIGWLNQDETCRRLMRSPRRLNELIESGNGPEKVLVQRPGKRPAPYYKPDDVERIERAMLPQPRVFPAGSGDDAGAIAVQPGALVDLVQRLGDRLAAAVERRAPLDRGPFLKIPAAAKEFGIPARTLKAVACVRYFANDPDVFRTSRGGLRIRRLFVASIDARELHAADNVRPEAIAAARADETQVLQWLNAPRRAPLEVVS